MKRSYHVTVVALVAVAITFWALPSMAQGRYAEYRWADKAGFTTIDSLAYKVKGKRVIGNAAPDTLVGATADTTASYRIDGAAAINLTVWNTKVAAGTLCTYTVQVSEDRTHWSSLATTFTLAESASLANSPSFQVLLDTSTDTTLAGYGTNADRRKIATASWLRVICSNAYVSGTDTTIHTGLLKARWK